MAPGHAKTKVPFHHHNLLMVRQNVISGGTCGLRFQYLLRHYNIILQRWRPIGLFHY